MEGNKKDIGLQISRAVEPLEGLFDVLQTVIENFGLDNVDLTEDQQLDLITKHLQLYNNLHHIQCAIRETLENVQPLIDGID